MGDRPRASTGRRTAGAHVAPTALATSSPPFAPGLVRVLVRVAALVFAALAAVPAGAQAPRAPADDASRPAPPVRLELWTIELERDFSPFVEESLDAFEAAHPGTETVWRDVTLNDLEERLAEAHARGAAPDVVNVNVPLALGFAERGWLRDLGPSLSADDVTRYFPDLLDSFRIDGRETALPWYLTAPVLFYDPDAFVAAGLDPDDPPATTAEMFETARTLHARLGTPGIWPNLSGQQLLYRFLEAGLPVTDADSVRATFDTDAHAALLEELVILFEAGIVPGDAFDENVGTPASAFLAGRIPMVTANPTLLARMRAENAALYARVRAAPYPLGPGEVIHAPLMGLAVTAASDEPERALDLARHLAGDERLLAFARVAEILPATRGAAADPWFRSAGADATPEVRARRVASEQLSHARDLTMELPNASALFGRFEHHVVRAFLRFHAPIEALRAAARFWNALL
jgi:ABC-type glycerol-3-phosphate transport system substrate-binding protein